MFQRYRRFAGKNRAVVPDCTSQGVFHIVDFFPKTNLCKFCGLSSCNNPNPEYAHDIKNDPFYFNNCVKCGKLKDSCPQYNNEFRPCHETFPEALKTIQEDVWKPFFEKVDYQFRSCMDTCNNRMEERRKNIEELLDLINAKMHQIDMELRNDEFSVIAETEWEKPNDPAQLTALIEDFEMMRKKVKKDLDFDETFELRIEHLKLKKQQLRNELKCYLQKYRHRLEINELRFTSWHAKFQKRKQDWYEAKFAAQ